MSDRQATLFHFDDLPLSEDDTPRTNPTEEIARLTRKVARLEADNEALQERFDANWNLFFRRLDEISENAGPRRFAAALVEGAIRDFHNPSNEAPHREMAGLWLRGQMDHMAVIGMKDACQIAGLNHTKLLDMGRGLVEPQRPRARQL